MATDSEVCCPVCWGSHGCSKPAGHDGIHECGPPPACSEFEETGPATDKGEIPGRVRYNYDDEGTDWSDWLDSTGFRV